MQLAKPSNLIRTNRYFNVCWAIFAYIGEGILPFFQRVQLILIGRLKKAFIAGHPNNALHFLQLFFGNCTLCLRLWGSLYVSTLVAFTLTGLERFSLLPFSPSFPHSSSSPYQTIVNYGPAGYLRSPDGV